MTNKELSQLLHRSFDEALTAEERDRLERALALSKELRTEQRILSALRSKISSLQKRQFSPLFAQRVMREIDKHRRTIDESVYDFSLSLMFSFRKIAVVGAILILLLLCGNFLSDGAFSLDKALGLQQVTLEDAWTLSTPLSENAK